MLNRIDVVQVSDPSTILRQAQYDIAQGKLRRIVQ